MRTAVARTIAVVLGVGVSLLLLFRLIGVGTYFRLSAVYPYRGAFYLAAFVGFNSFAYSDVSGEFIYTFTSCIKLKRSCERGTLKMKFPSCLDMIRVYIDKYIFINLYISSTTKSKYRCIIKAARFQITRVFLISTRRCVQPSIF